ncbi:hypothetical protein HY416_02870 [Candidatus Kaiserbacteria bacterium]|nr:hypothetical protein [Candidatus Kaiserbacteria bacterium]
MTYFVHNSIPNDDEKEDEFSGGALGDFDDDFDGDDGTDPLEEDDDDESYISSFDDRDDY